MPVRTKLITMTPLEILTYKDYTIEEDYRNSKIPEFMYYPTSQGVQHDADYDGESFKYTGNCKWADTLEEAKEAIDELTLKTTAL